MIISICSADTVLIESDWNLKKFKGILGKPADTVLIESDWNLKILQTLSNSHSASINRIRLEFKVSAVLFVADVIRVLIESDWNLKE